MKILYFFIEGFLIGGIGTCLGGVFSLLIRDPSDRIVSGFLSFAAGIMLSVISFDLLPEAYNIGGFFIVTLGLTIGLFMVLFAEEMIPQNRLKKYKGKKLGYFRMSIIVMISMSLHNFPEGVAVGSSYAYSQELGLKIGILIAAHDIPEGMSIGVPLILAGVSPLKVVLLTLLTGLPTAFGTVFGAVLGDVSEFFIGFCLAAAASSMLYVSANQLLPEASVLHKGKSSAVFLLVGFICGCYLSLAT
jgi:ZIP family zinc transporter